VANLTNADREQYARTNAELEKVHLARVDKDLEAADAFLVEQARLALYGALAIAGGTLSAAWSASRPLCLTSLKLGLWLLFLGTVAAWNALTWARTHRLNRVTLSHMNLRDARTQIFGQAYMYAPLEPGELGKAERLEHLSEQAVTWLTVVAYGFSAAGTAAILDGIFNALGRRGCWVFTIWPLTHLN